MIHGIFEPPEAQRINEDPFPKRFKEAFFEGNYSINEC